MNALKLQKLTTRTTRLLLESPQRCLATMMAKKDDPLVVWRQECVDRNLCDSSGSRHPGVHWTFTLAFNTSDVSVYRNPEKFFSKRGVNTMGCGVFCSLTQVPILA